MPDSSLSSVSSAPDENYPDLFEDDGSIDPTSGFDSPDYVEISTDEAIAFEAGDYTPNGWLQNTKLKILPLGGEFNLSCMIN